MITEQQRQVREQLIKLKSEIEKATNNNLLYKPITSKLGKLIKDMETKTFPQEQLDSSMSVFNSLATQLGVKNE